MQKHIPRPIYGLQSWTIEKRGTKFYVAPTATSQDKAVWLGPYATLQRATTAIARKLAEEFTVRHERLCGFHGAAP